MNFLSPILDVIKTLNSSQKPWQITLAVLLGIFLGLLPLFHPFHFLIFFIALFLNLNYGVMVAVFSFVLGISPFFDGMLHKIGLTLLTAGPLQGLWTALYNIECLRFLWMHNTICLGSFVFSVALSIPGFFVGNFILGKAKTLIEFLGSLPVLKYILAIEKEEGEESKKVRIFLWKRVIAGGIFAVLLGGGGYFFLNPLAKWAFEKSASRIAGTEVTTSSVHLAMPLSVEIQDVQMANPKHSMTNLVEAKRVHFSLNPWKAMERKVRIPEATIEEIRFDQQRKTEAQKMEGLDWGKMGIGSFGKALENLKSLKMGDYKKFLKDQNLDFLKLVEVSQGDLELIRKKWEVFLKSWEQKGKDRQKEMEDLKKRAENLKTPEDVRSLVEDSKRLYNELQKDYKELENLNASLEADRKKISGLQEQFKSMTLSDWEKLRKHFSLGGEGSIQLVDMLLGGNFTRNLENFLQLYEKSLSFMGNLAPKLPERRGGEWIAFKENKPSPKVVVEKAHLSVLFLGTKLQGEGKDISSDSRVYGKPGIITVSGSKTKAYDLVQVKIELTHKENTPMEKIELQLEGIQIGDFQAFGGMTLKDPKIHIRGQIEILSHGNLSGEVKVIFSPVRFQIASKSGDELAQMIVETLEGVDHFSVTASLGGTLKDWKMKLSSDLDQRLGDSIKNKLTARSKEMEQSLEKVFQTTVKDESKGMNETSSLLQQSDQKLQGEKNTSSSLQSELQKNYTMEGLQKKLLQKSPIKNPLDGKIKNPLEGKIKNPF